MRFRSQENEQMSNRRATVFGGSGFLGRYIVKRLVANGIVTRVATRNPDDALPLKTLGPVGHVVPVAARLDKKESVRNAVAGVDIVVNLVGILYESGGQTFRSVHVDGARNVARAAREAGVTRLLHVSALGADAQSPSAYARSKAEGEAAVREEFPGATILRPSIVIGPEDQFFNRFGWMTRYSPILPLIGGGHTRFQPVYVGDVADAAIAALKDPKADGTTFELGGPLTYTFRELLELLLREIGRKRILMSVPFGLASFKAAILEKLPSPLLTRDQLELLKRDNVESGTLPGFTELGLTPRHIEVVLPTYLARFRKGGSLSNPGPLKTGE
jgi:uncharacterized protein YbjT (DUF2867 family)